MNDDEIETEIWYRAQKSVISFKGYLNRSKLIAYFNRILRSLDMNEIKEPA